MKFETVRLDVDIDPFAVGARSGLLWCRATAADPVPLLAGLGTALRIEVGRPTEVDGAQRALAGIGGVNTVEGAGTGPIAFAAFPFDREAPGELIVPEIVIGRGADGRWWITVVSDGSLGIDEAIGRARAVADPPVADPPVADPPVDGAPGQRPLAPTQASFFEVRSVLAPELWRDEVVTPARDRIRSGALDKAVLGREVLVVADAPIDQAEVLHRLRDAFPAAIVFSVEGFLGASPELLVSRHGDVVRAHPLAGTAPRSSDPSADGRLAAGLLASSKDRWEHQITIDWLLDGLLPFCSYVDAEPEPSIVSLANVHHLGTLVEGRLSSPPASVLELVGALHPTPAVGGAPQDHALELIRELERADRGRYAGPVGWLDGGGNGAFAVGIRSAEVVGNEARLFAGVGVVGDSDPVAELAETRSKFRAMLGALIQP